MAQTKICGIRTAAEYDCASAGGAAWVGTVFCPESPRNLSLEEAAALRDHGVSRRLAAERVAVVVDTDDAALEAIIAAAAPALLQCHGGESPERVTEIRERFGLPVMKAVRVEDERSLEEALAYDGVADRLLFDSAPKDAALPGGTGHVFDWSLMRRWKGATPWMLAGGLTPDTVQEAIAASGAEAVDVSSGVEDSPGVKDHDAIRRFVSAARSASNDALSAAPTADGATRP